VLPPSPVSKIKPSKKPIRSSWKKRALFCNVDYNRKVALENDKLCNNNIHSGVNEIGGDKNCIF
jgi:hypothetical protein